jgi:3-oxo-5alpha-steroid 4-dehydrogenase
VPATALAQTVGICSNSYISGLSLADCIFSGRRVGLHAGGKSHAA